MTGKMIKNPSINSLHEAQLQVLVFPKPKKASLISKLVTDVVVVGALGLSILFFNLFAKSYQRGFNCNDDSIRYPYHDDTITSTGLIIYSLVIPICSILINEFLIIRSEFLKDQVDDYLTSRHFWICYAWQSYMQIWPSFLFAAAVSQFITEISKYTIGRLRPHFIDLCQPQIESTGQILLRNSTCSYPYTYVEKYHCTNDKYSGKLMKDAHLSFMSGHSSFSSVCLIYLVFYIQNRVKWSWIGMTRHLYQAGLIFLVVYTGLSRISDYKHHWSDVLTGLIQGTLTATLVATFVSDLVRIHTFYRIDSVEGVESGSSGGHQHHTTFDSNV